MLLPLKSATQEKLNQGDTAGSIIIAAQALIIL
jgi:hypothetical protein